MSRVFPVVLVAALVGCSGSVSDTGSSPSPRAKSNRPEVTPKKLPVPDPAAPKDSTKERPQAQAPHTPERFQELIAGLASPNEATRVSAANELRGWGKAGAEAAGPLALAIATSGDEARAAALGALEAVLPERAADVHALVADDDPARRIAAAKHLGSLSQQEGRTALLPLIRWRIVGLPVEARKLSGGYGKAGEEYAALAPLLLKWGVDPTGLDAVASCATVSPDGGKPLWEPAQLTLCEIAHDERLRPEALKALDRSLSSRPSAATLRAVGELGPNAKSLTQLLQDLAADRDAEVRKAAAEALKKVQQ